MEGQLQVRKQYAEIFYFQVGGRHIYNTLTPYLFTFVTGNLTTFIKDEVPRVFPKDNVLQSVR